MVTVPAGNVNVIFPLVPLPTIAVTCVAELIAKDAAGVPPKDTAVTPDRFLPLMVTIVPALADAGLNEVITGLVGEAKVNPGWNTLPLGVVRFTFPLAPPPITAFICTGEMIVNEAAGTPPKDTADTPAKLVPAIATVSPVAARDGVNEVNVAGPAAEP